MTTEPLDMTASIAPRSDQINAEDLLTGPRVVTITDVQRGSAEQPVNMVTAEFGPGRPYKPSKTMRRVIVAAWGKDASAYVGRRIKIYRDPDITFGRDKVGGIRISHLSHIDRRLEIALTVTRGRRAPFVVEPLPDQPRDDTESPPQRADIISDAQMKKLHVLFNAEGLTDRESRLAWCAQAISRDITTSKDLTKSEASSLIELLEQSQQQDGGQ